MSYMQSKIQKHNKFLIVLKNGLNYDYHLIIKELLGEFGGQFEYLGENTKKYISTSTPFSANRRKARKNKKVTFRIKFIDNVRFMVISLTCLVDNFAEKIHDSKCKDCKSSLEYLKNEDKFFIFKCLKRTKSHKKIPIKAQ